MVNLTPPLLEDARIGQRLRSIRQELGLTIQTVSKRSGISIATISKIENDKVSPTFASLLKLAEAFQMPLATLFGELNPSSPDTTARITITRREDVTFARTQTYEMGPLCANLRNKRMSPFLDRIHASGAHVGDRLFRHEGEEFVFVLQGVLEIHTEHYAPITLHPGDSAYFDCRMAHAYRSGDGSPAEMLVVWLPPEGSSKDLVSTITAFDGPPAKPTAHKGQRGPAKRKKSQTS